MASEAVAEETSHGIVRRRGEEERAEGARDWSELSDTSPSASDDEVGGL
jgi:hypothetical protein